MTFPVGFLKLRGFLGRTGLLWLLLCALAVWVYAPGLSGPPILDDAANLKSLELLNEGSDFAIDVVTENYSGLLGRPISMMSFVTEKLYFDAGVEGRKRVNLALHLLIATLLVGFSHEVFRFLQYRRAWELALVVGGVWLLAPLFLSSVLYVIQRMAQLAALLLLLVHWFYLRWRLGHGRLWLFLCMLVCCAAPFAKENGLLAVPMLIMMEWLLLGFHGLSSTRARQLQAVFSLIVMLGLVLAAALVVWQPDSLFASYEKRNFDLFERLMTQGRVLWSYIAQLLWPRSELLGIYQDGYSVSRAWLQPWTTLFAWLGWLVLIVGAWLLRCRVPLLLYGLVFFLLGHAMESSIFPLELYFEHRNYFPAMGLLLALVGLAGAIMNSLPWLAPWLGLSVVLIAGRGVGVLIKEVQLWTTELTIHFAAINRFPDSPRANIEYARVLASRGALDEAMIYAAKGEELDQRSGLRDQLVQLGLYCNASQAISQETMLALSAEPADFRDDVVSERMYVFVQQVTAGSCSQTDLFALADRFGQLAAVPPPESISPKMYVSLAILENHLQRYELALEYIEALLKRSPDSIRAKMMKLYFTSLLERSEEHLQVLAELQDLARQGRLNEQQRYNLSLFER